MNSPYASPSRRGRFSRSKKPNAPWEITFRFAVSPNQSSLQVGKLKVPNKRGWDYLWVRYADTEDTASHTLVKSPLGAYVERVYEEGDFSALGIGT